MTTAHARGRFGIASAGASNFAGLTASGRSTYGILRREITNIGASIGDQLCFLFGPAGTVLAGDSITVAVDVDIVMASVSGMLILSAPRCRGCRLPSRSVAARGDRHRHRAHGRRQRPAVDISVMPAAPGSKRSRPEAVARRQRRMFARQDVRGEPDAVAAIWKA